MKTTLHMSPFAILGVTTRDDRRRIVAVAEEMSLELDPDVCQKARSDLTSPRNRLIAEIAWFPGVSPRKATQALESLLSKRMAVRQESGLPTLPHLNLLAAALEPVNGEYNADDLVGFIEEIAYLADNLNSEAILRDINEDRAVSGFPEVRSVDQIEIELAERKRYYCSVIKSALDSLPTMALVQVMTDVVNRVTAGGENHAPELIDDLVDSYEVEAQGFLQSEAEIVRKLIKAVRDAAGAGESAVKPYVDKLEAVVRNWDNVAQPIQLSSKARGIDHEPSRELGWAIRSLAVDIFNGHDMLKQSQRLTSLIQELFSEVPDVSDRVSEDSEVLTDIQQRRNEAEAINPVRDLVEEVLKSIELSPDTASADGERLLIEGMALLDASPIKAESATYCEGKDIIAAGAMQCAIAFGNKTSQWAPCVSLLQRALELASDTNLRKRISDNLVIAKGNSDNFGDLEPIGSAPSLRTINGIGFALYGKTDSKPGGSYMATYYFVFFFIPIWPIARYRVISSGRGYRFLGKAKLRAFDKWHIGVFLGLMLIVLLNG
ncbi:hypothetical protein SAMN05443245_7644 [Paraburkholderia fungorum]|uniref:Uncharacterized protein n=1 Tax=Paraburkholderia fungorum TaxID=134537 RepID=A0A1H1JYY4_9BURK|nr:hypothetical protein [Paraburkholderia fungorum]SDR55271.1 hypothetical protein SAMN05443245_7644 [Paraburkholderia fungorum]